ncbi:RNA helicase [Vibrio splendidus]|uniref:RNA helicase n=1 Tax=Vibrio splendidus TaxID=29497 RepID=A0A2N7F5Q9_VIBSP|nr:RNA helicase [Vibrio splendidus]OMO30550.1 RNA helicase [Vibrio splendidus]PMG35341.1 RNA helicase [Vibrio splendidus]PMJ60989.1 RNA helicase [Vibrio splendidus]PMJ95032.1 RNA helicase [Vibrio splendidus]
MAANPHYTGELEYELCYFDDGKLTTITICASNRQEAMTWYLSEGKHINDIYSLRPDE